MEGIQNFFIWKEVDRLEVVMLQIIDDLNLGIW